MVSAAQVDELTRFNASVTAGIAVELRALGRAVGSASPEVARDALLEVAPSLVDRRGRLVAAGSAEWFERVRRSELGGTFSARLGPLPDPDVVRRNVRYAAGALFEVGRVSPFESLAGSLVRHVEDVSRGTVRENVMRDTRAVGWNRIARADGCDFCVMLSQRGAVYKKSTADFASHDKCRCRAAPSWDPAAPEVDVRAYEASQRMGSVRARANDPSLSPAHRAKAQRALDNQTRRTREWIDANRWRLDDFRSELT